MKFQLRPYRVVVKFKNEGETYGTETYTVFAVDEDQAERKARVNASASKYDDERMPDRRVVIASVDEVDDEDLAA